MRISKDYEERRNEILDTAEKLFTKKGYEKCTVNDILREISIAKGTFYYYFKSKQEVLEAIVTRYTDFMMTKVQAVMNQDLQPEQKFMQVFLAMRINNEVGEEVLNEMHQPDNALLHQKTLQEIVEKIAPVLVEIIEEGIDKNVWQCKYPLQYMQIFLASSLTLTDEGIFEMDADAQMNLGALISLLEKMLEVKEDFFMTMFLENWG
ncbi:TetR/AcrR family transcriptional regulator [Metabacillus malikii]|uniref:AcrR family transcriptional regulator n=1 Tax=Metabacillus malikii TaxID=1504265 RepID=A0ABT9ZLU3_9BACI|nr:TetR/AcrR family transcriptional regulator [Metabacillus malikii]MDQ0233263.1 AcrR family transcriptional regulator [Metabacillus malikii]